MHDIYIYIYIFFFYGDLIIFLFFFMGNSLIIYLFFLVAIWTNLIKSNVFYNHIFHLL